MPLIAHNKLPTFRRLADEGQDVLETNAAHKQDIRELHIGLLNMMPDAALQATERQFLRLIGSCNRIAQFRVHLFSIPGLPRGEAGQAHLDAYYESFEDVREQGLDALIVTGANVTHPHLQEEPFWEPLNEVFNWAHQHVTSVLCSCLATHALIQHEFGIERRHRGSKTWGVFPHNVTDRSHPLVNDINTRFDVPHSRFNDISREQMESVGMHVLAESPGVGVHLAVSPDGFRVVYFQGHPEYDSNSLLKEYKRDALLFHAGRRDDQPPFPENYLNPVAKEILSTFQNQLLVAARNGDPAPEFPEDALLPLIDNTWRDTAKAIVNNWLGKVYQTTDPDRHRPFMTLIDPTNPLGWQTLSAEESNP